MSMNMNRETRRRLQQQGAVNEAGAPTRGQRTATAPRPKEERPSARQFLGEVRGELRKVAWPTRSEVINYSIVVLITVALMTLIIAGLDYLLGRGSLWLFNV